MSALLDSVAAFFDFLFSMLRSAVFMVTHLPEFVASISQAVGYMPDFLIGPLMLGVNLVLLFAIIKLF